MPARARGAPEPDDGPMRMSDHADDGLVTLPIADEWVRVHADSRWSSVAQMGFLSRWCRLTGEPRRWNGVEHRSDPSHRIPLGVPHQLTFARESRI